MNEEEEASQATRQRFEDLCRALNMDEAAGDEAWRNYEKINKNYTLEGSELHWLACSLYVACRTAVPTVGKGTAEGNYVSLTRILRCSEQSLIEFFSKMKKWEDMASLPPHFREHTRKLERNFTVSAVIFKKYAPIFQDIFRDPSQDPPRVQRSRKQRRRHPCTVSEVFSFCWILFVHAKGNFPMISDDLVNSYHLLLCALDLVYCNALLCPGRKDLLNPGFKGLPEEFGSKDYKPGPGPLGFIEKLCELHDGLVLEAKGVKEHFWKPFIKKLFDKKILKGKEENLTGFLDPVNFGDSFAALNRVYEEHVLATGSLDERIFLAEDASEEIGTPGQHHCVGAAEAMDHSTEAHSQSRAHAMRLSTPLTGRRYVRESSQQGTPVSMATQSVSRLHGLLSGLKHGPSAKLAQALRSCARDPTLVITSRVKEMFETFCLRYSGKGEGNASLFKDLTVKYFRLAEALYYKTLETVIDQERKRLGDTDLSGILEQDIFHRSLLACCLEVVIFSYRPPGEFPRVLEIFHLPPYQFYKVIEVLVRAEEGLFREAVKHLNQVEEQVLEKLAWKGESPLWESIREAKNRAPACQEVMQPQHLESTESPSASNTPVTPSRLSEIRAGKGASVSPATLHDRYRSPPAGTARRRLFLDSDSTPEAGSPARAPQAPLVSSVPVQSIAAEAISITPVPGQTVVTMATATVTANNGQTVTIPVQGIANENGGITFIPVQVSMPSQAAGVGGSLQPLTAQTLSGTLTTQQLSGVASQVSTQNTPPVGQQAKAPAAHSPAENKPRKTGSLTLAAWQVYHLASVRLRDLCAKLDISAELRRRIWTCFEYSLVHCTDLMVDRHLDQLLMCAIYVMAKVTKEDKSFQNIMKCYRTQPQANSSVYRSVLISRRRRRSSSSSDSSARHSSPSEAVREHASRDSSPVPMRSSSTLPVPQASSAPPTPTRLSSAPPGQEEEQEEERGDLILFYNNVYVKHIRDFALRYSPVSLAAPGTEAPPLSPYPAVRTVSPRRVLLSQNHSIYLSPHKNTSPLSTRDKIFYYISSSPSKKLREINSMIKTGETPTKKRGLLLEEGGQSPAKRLCQDNQTALLRRLQDVANDRGSH
uniref:Retinoblastoma-like protein 2 n=1 Tax=Lepisosteus oculatus TaxID=7918 RepID=W5MK11_LEPOC